MPSGSDSRQVVVRATRRRLTLATDRPPAGAQPPVASVPRMPELIAAPTRVEAAGEPPKVIAEHVGRVNSAEERVSVARMRSPSGWSEPFQTPEFDEWTLVLAGALQVDSDSGTLHVAAGQAVVVRAGERIRYSSPGPDGAEYVAVCLPAFSPETVHRDA